MGDCFDFAGEDNPDRFSPDSPTVAQLFTDMLAMALQHETSTIRLAWDQQSVQISFWREVHQRDWFVDRRYVAQPLMTRILQRAGLTSAEQAADGLLPFTDESGVEHQFPVSLERTPAAETIVITIRDAASDREA